MNLEKKIGQFPPRPARMATTPAASSSARVVVNSDMLPILSKTLIANLEPFETFGPGETEINFEVAYAALKTFLKRFEGRPNVHYVIDLMPATPSPTLSVRGSYLKLFGSSCEALIDANLDAARVLVHVSGINYVVNFYRLGGWQEATNVIAALDSETRVDSSRVSSGVRFLPHKTLMNELEENEKAAFATLAPDFSFTARDVTGLAASQILQQLLEGVRKTPVTGVYIFWRIGLQSADAENCVAAIQLWVMSKCKDQDLGGLKPAVPASVDKIPLAPPPTQQPAPQQTQQPVQQAAGLLGPFGGLKKRRPEDTVSMAV